VATILPFSEWRPPTGSPAANAIPHSTRRGSAGDEPDVYRCGVSLRVLPLEQWRALEAAHEERVDAATAAHRERRQDGRAHPVEDFLFRYYNNSPARLRRWHPGAGVVLEDAAGLPRATWAHYRTEADAVCLDLGAFLAARGPAVAFVRDLLTATASRPAQLGCFGLHEWAMVHGIPADDVRHSGWSLRLGTEGTDAVVERHGIRCSHFDAYRFFTPTAAPRNALRPTRDTQVAMEQPGCLHAGMDVYKWAFKLTPLVPSDLVADAFDLAREIRVLDMQASPYDLRDLGHEPVPIETPEGRATYLERQRTFAERSNGLRHRMIAVIDAALAGEGVTSAAARS